MCSPITLLFSSTMLTSPLSTIVGAPTFPFLHAGKVLQAHEFRCRCGASAPHERTTEVMHLQKALSPLKEAERPFDPDEAYGAHKPRCATRRAIIRRTRKIGSLRSG
jgi:hypothetical protein